MAGIRWVCFIIKDNKSFYFDSFGGNLDKFLHKHLPKPKISHNYKIHDLNSILCGFFCLHFFFSIGRLYYLLL